mmetsp:Transcript_39744/g.104994  ORF Transcript_39744/g.104994 Transcript_39744/m.104994 type:complete len:229 (+) Transcript_39744:439-1125(+)
MVRAWKPQRSSEPVSLPEALEHLVSRPPCDHAVIHSPHLEHIAFELAHRRQCAAVGRRRSVWLSAQAHVSEGLTRSAAPMQQLGIQKDSKLTAATHGEMVAMAEHKEVIHTSPATDVQRLVRRRQAFACWQRRQAFKTLHREEKRLAIAVEGLRHTRLAPFGTECTEDVARVVLDDEDASAAFSCETVEGVERDAMDGSRVEEPPVRECETAWDCDCELLKYEGREHL